MNLIRLAAIAIKRLVGDAQRDEERRLTAVLSKASDLSDLEARMRELERGSAFWVR
ncbi:DUF3563 family protein [Chitinasiproducens palmae]|uniref:DUF3563 domain-containing protein n=1 Tax=Chitinasiproducens palmae TaxID=1770053 RepID=A0A1H2PRN8_9BURK|nr:DUF3563 family protein [Chitinasiproducens palmae]SDV49144.1 Protein of unknown function [Chitinasiproducens palmae]